MKKLLLVFSIIATFGIVVTASTITYSETSSKASSSIDFEGEKEKKKQAATSSCTKKACCSKKKTSCSEKKH